MALACFFSHIAAFGVYALAIIGVEILPAAADLRARQWPALGRRIAIVVVQFVAPAALWLGFRHDAPSSTVSYTGFWRKADLLFSVFDNYNRAFDVFCFALFLALIGWLVWTRRLGLAPRLVAAAGIVFAAYLVLPSQIHGGSGADHRLPTAFFLLLVAASAPNFPSARFAKAVGVIAALVLVAAFGHDRVRLARRGSGLFGRSGRHRCPAARQRKSQSPIPHLFHVVPIPEVHLALLAIPRREAFVPTLFAIAGQQPVALKPAFAALADAVPPQPLWAILMAAQSADRALLPTVLEQFDFVAIVDKRPISFAAASLFGAGFRAANLSDLLNQP